MQSHFKKGDLIVFNSKKVPVRGTLSGPQYSNSLGIVLEVVPRIDGIQVMVNGVVSLVDKKLIEKFENTESELL